jgi:phage terminase small subunit
MSTIPEEKITEEQLAAPLNDRQAMFCRFYVTNFNATRAAKSAGYSENTAYSQGHDLLKKPEIQAYIRFLADKLVSDAEIGVQRLLREHARIAFFDIADLYDEAGNMLHPQELPAEIRAVIAGIDVEIIGRYGRRDPDGDSDDRPAITSVKLKLADKHKSLEALAKYHKIFADRLELGMDSDLAAAILAGRRRAQQVWEEE